LNIDDTVSGLKQELRRGTLILLVLSQLREDMYGYSLVKQLNDHDIPMDANTLYPLLRRLEGQGLLESRWDTGESKPRKYYKITADGLTVLEKTTAYWRDFSANVEELLR
jgi:DNA-binding PadR family transcriptional regulator